MSDDNDGLVEAAIALVVGFVGLFKYKITWFISLAFLIVSSGIFTYRYVWNPFEDKDEATAVVKPVESPKPNTGKKETESIKTAPVRSRPAPPQKTSPDKVTLQPAATTSAPATKEQPKTADNSSSNKKRAEAKAPIVNNDAPKKVNTPPPPPPSKYPGYDVKRYPSGEKYEGYFNARGLRHGKGTYLWPNGDKYVGDWINDEATGQGIYYSREGWRYEGKFQNLVFHGAGTYYFANGKSKKGVWLNGKLK